MYSGECYILFESLDICGFKTGKNDERSFLVTELKHFECLKYRKRVIFYYFLRNGAPLTKIIQLSEFNFSKITPILPTSLSVPQQLMCVLYNRKDGSQKSLATIFGYRRLDFFTQSPIFQTATYGRTRTSF